MTRPPVLLAVLLVAATAWGLEVSSVVSPLDGVEFFENPGCGFAGGAWTTLSPGMKTNGLDLCASTPNCTKLWSLHKFSKGYVYKDNAQNYTNHVMRFVGGADIPLDENALLSVSNSLLNCRRNGGTCIPRFAYTFDQWGGVEPDDFDVLLTHIRQLSGVLSQFRDVVPAVECGIIGAWGEMHTSRYSAPEYQNRIVGAWLDGLPKDMALLARSSYVWTAYLDMPTSKFFAEGGMESIDPAIRPRMGFYNDGYLGTDWDYGTWGGGNIWTRKQGQTFLRNQAVPYGGEFAWVGTNYFDKNVHLLDTNRFNLVQEWYDMHLSFLRNIRDKKMGVVLRLSQTPFSSAKWAFDGMPRLSEYDGVDLRKFCEDHMGYRYVVRGVSAQERKNGATLDVVIENTGFGQLLFADSPEVLLLPADGGQAVRCPTTPSASLTTLRGGASDTFSLSFDFPKPLAAGQYGVYLRVRAPLADETPSSIPRRVVRFANKNGYNAELKANYLCTLSLGTR